MASTRELVEKALEISKQRRELLTRMAEAVRLQDKDAVFKLACKLVGLSDEECRRTNPRIN